MKNITAIVLIVASIGIYFGYTSRTITSVMESRKQVKAYDDALETSRTLKSKIEELDTKVASFNQEDLARLDKMIPNNADNVRLLIDIDNIARDYGMTTKNIKVDEGAKQGSEVVTSRAPYESVTISFSTTSTYENYMIFLRALETSLRVVDPIKLSVTSTDNPNAFTFDITLKTYWLNSNSVI